MRLNKLTELIEEDKKASEDLVGSKRMSTSTSNVKKFTDTLVTQSWLMQKLLVKKNGSTKKNIFKDQIAKKFDKLFNRNQTNRDEGKPLRMRTGPKLYLHKPHVIQTRNEFMLYKYDVKEKKYTRHNTSNSKSTMYHFPSFCDLLNGSIFVSGGLKKADDTDPVGNAFTIKGYQ